MKWLFAAIVLLPLAAKAQPIPYPPSATYCNSTGAWIPCPANTSTAGGVIGPTTTVVNDLATWNNTTGTNLSDSGVQVSNLALLSATNTFAGIITAPALTLTNTAGTWKPVSFNTGSTQRWQIGSDNDAETGSNAGSDFDIFSYNDNGTTLTDVLHIQRASGVATFADNAVAPEVDINGTLGNFKLLRYETAGAFDFSIGLDQVGNYTVFRHNPANNSVIDTPLVVSLSTGAVGFSQRPGWAVNGTQATPWDSVNLNPANFMPITPGTVDDVPVAILSDPISNATGGNSANQAVTFVSGDLHSQLSIYPSATAGNAPPGGTSVNNVVQAGDAAILVSQPNSGLPALTLGIAAPETPSNAGIRFAETPGAGSSISLGVRPTFAGNLAWDAGNLNPANFLSTSGGTISGTLTVTGLTTLPGVVISGTAINATAPISAPLIQATGTGTTQGIFDSGQLTAAGPITLGNTSASSTTVLGSVTIGQGTTTGTLNVINGITTPALNSSGNTPTAVVGAGAGTGATISVAGTAMSGAFNVTAGSSPVAGGIVATITTTSTSFASVPFCVVSAGSPATAILYTTPNLSSGTLTVVFTLANNAQLTNGTSYTFNWFCP